MAEQKNEGNGGKLLLAGLAGIGAFAVLGFLWFAISVRAAERRYLEE